MTQASRSGTTRRGATLTLGQVIREARVERGLSVQELARQSEIARSYLYRVEEDSFGSIQVDTFCRLIETLHLSADRVLGEIGFLPPAPTSPVPQPADYLRERYKLSPGDIAQAIDFIEFLVSRERRLRRANP
jgi:transcriptional regulator with XRE-family HTH domain